jgi:hypothetical protein
MEEIIDLEDDNTEQAHQDTPTSALVVKKPNPRHADGLTELQSRFAYFYVTDARMNASEAARLAGYTGEKQQLASTASTLLRNPVIRNKINEHLSVFSMSAPEILSELTTIAKFPVEEYTDPRMLTNKLKALELLAKHHGLLVERVDHTSGGQALTFADLAKMAKD